MDILSRYLYLRGDNDKGLNKEYLNNAFHHHYKIDNRDYKASLVEAESKEYINSSTEGFILKGTRMKLKQLSQKKNLDNQTILKELFASISLGVQQVSEDLDYIVSKPISKVNDKEKTDLENAAKKVVLAPLFNDLSIDFHKLNNLTEEFEKILDSNEHQNLIYETTMDLINVQDDTDKEISDPYEIIEKQKFIILKHLEKIQENIDKNQFTELRQLFTKKLKNVFLAGKMPLDHENSWLENKLNSEEKDLSWLNLNYFPLNKYARKISLNGSKSIILLIKGE